MSVQVLVAAMNQTNHSLLEKMNIHSDVIVGNQCDYDSVERFEWNGYKAIYLNFAERGVGLNRNNALMRASGDICIFADDDIVYYDDYVDRVEKVFNDKPYADVIIFNIKSYQNNSEYHDVVTKDEYVGRRGISSHGAFSIGVRLDKINKKNIVFHRMFGGGTEYSCGEDTIFLQDCVKKGLKIYATRTTIGMRTGSESTWFFGYTDKFFYDKGVLYKHLYPKLAKGLSIYHVIKHRNLYSDYGLMKAIDFMWRGVRETF